MRTINSEKLMSLQKNISNIRNICILAHVDHGKTTLADALVARNGVISSRMAGKIRYMDSRKDEQERGITMKSSAIALHHLANDGADYLINLIDSPGHVDFSSEVSTAVRLCDGALIVIDVVEGVCPQTTFAIRQAWTENLTPILILNKIDRLIIEKKLTPIDAHVHIMQILEQTNAVMGELFSSNIYEKATLESEAKKAESTERVEVSDKQIYDWDVGLDDSDDSNLYFTPEQGNVIFASAYDRWGFSLNHFADLYSSKLGIQKNLLLKTLWGDYYINMKAKKIMKGAQAKAKKPLFVQFILENIWKVYETFLERKDKEGMMKMCETLNVKVQARDVRHSDPRVYLQAMFSEWLPLGKSVLEMVSEKLPSPNNIPEEKVEKLMRSKTYNFQSLPEETQKLKEEFLKCCGDDESTVIVYVSKLFPIETDALPQNQFKPLTAEELSRRREEARARHVSKQKENVATEEQLHTPLTMAEEPRKVEDEKPHHVLIAFARIFSGVIKKGRRLYVLGPKHNPAMALEQARRGVHIDPNLTLKDLKSDEHISSFVVGDLYLLMGREVESLDEVRAGNVFGIGGLQEHILKTATISNTIACQPFSPLNIEAKPIVRVALEPKQSGDMDALIKGLRLLNQADACVEVYVQETGEHVLVSAGEVHLQRCIDDLRYSYANVDISVSSPIVPFRETVVAPPKLDMVNEVIENQNQVVKPSNQSTDDSEPVQSITVNTPDKKSVITVTVKPLPKSVTQLLDDSSELIRIQDQWMRPMICQSNKFEFNEQTISNLAKFRNDLKEAFSSAGPDWIGAEDHIWSFGPRRCGTNILLNKTVNYEHLSVWWDRRSLQTNGADPRSAYDNSFISGFQMATIAGPLCEEPMMGVCFVVNEWKIESANSSKVEASDAANPYGPLSGQIMAVVKDCCRQAFQAQPQRLVAAMYSCHIQATPDVLGRLCAVLSKRGGRVLHGDMQEGSQMFDVTALLPVVESFNLAGEIRKQTSGLANPQLVFSHWEVLETDPFWVPTTAEEYLHFGDKADSENRAARYVTSVRKRKGLSVAEKIVEHAEKQRTLTRNK